jgi:D-alanyl-D-alanine-carboxypeptidase/D-alanyl-D-alanine-endopeptidase
VPRCCARKEGHDDGVQNYCITFDRARTAIVLMTNSDNGESMFKELLATLIGDTFTPVRWEGYVPYNERVAAFGLASTKWAAAAAAVGRRRR